MSINELISILEQRLNTIRREKEEIENRLISPLTKLKESIVKVILEPSKLQEIDVDIFQKQIPDIDDNIIKKLRLYTKFYKNNMNVTPEQEKYIKDSFNSIIDIIDNKIRDINEEAPEIELKNKELKELEVILKYLNNLLTGEYLKSTELEEISNYLKEVDYIREMPKINVYSEIVVRSLDNINSIINKKEELQSNNEEVKEITYAQRTNLNEEKVILLFNKYGLRFKDFKKEDQKTILTYANINEMDKVLEIIRNNHIYLNISERSTNISEILTFSNSEILLNIIDNIKEDIKSISKKVKINAEVEVYDVNKIFQSYLRESSIFIKKSYKLEKRLVYASYDNYLSNRNIFKSIGIDLKRASIKSPEIFTYSNSKVIENIDSLNYYNIPSDVYEEKLTVLKSPNILGTIDQFIEVGYFEDYALHNPTRLISKPDDIIFYRIIKSRQEGKSHSSLFYGSTHKFKGEITSLNSKLYDMTEGNKSSLVGEYHPNILLVNIKPALSNEFVPRSNYISLLEQFKTDEFRYVIDGITVSRKKVLRYYESVLKNYGEDNFEGLRYSIFKNSIFTKEMCDRIDNKLDAMLTQSKGVGLQ